MTFQVLLTEREIADSSNGGVVMCIGATFSSDGQRRNPRCVNLVGFKSWISLTTAIVVIFAFLLIKK